MKHPELLAPAGSMEAVQAAVRNGADAVYLGFGTFNARRGAKNFTEEEMRQAIAYCRLRGVKTNIAVNTIVGDREIEPMLHDVELLLGAGADALIVQDLGAARRIRARFPEAVLHASTQMTVHSLEGALFAKEEGFDRVVLSRELPMSEIRRITAEAGIETEVFVHGALCMSYSGQCALSAVIGRRSGNRGLCAQPCRLPYNGKNNYPLSLKDLCLVSQLRELTEAGVASLKIEGRMKRPEYVAVVTGIYAAVLREQRAPTKQELRELDAVFSRQGFTQGYYRDKVGPDMFGTRSKDGDVKELYARAAQSYTGKEEPSVPVAFSFFAQTGRSIRLEACADGQQAAAEAPAPEMALHRAATREDITRALSKTGGTVFVPEFDAVELEDGLSIPARTLNALRRQVLEDLTNQRTAPRTPQRGQEPAALPYENKPFAGYTVQARRMEQLRALGDLPFRTVYLPVDELLRHPEETKQLLERHEVVPVLPRIVWTREEKAALDKLEQCKTLGCRAALCRTVGHIAPVQRLGLDAYGDFSFNVFNSDALDALCQRGITRQTLSFELRLAQVRDLRKPMDTELIVAGRLPLMLTENCMLMGAKGGCRRDGTGVCTKEGCGLTDRTGATFPVFREEHCRSSLYNSQPLALSPEEFQTLGVGYARLLLTDETPEQAAQVLRDLLEGRMPDFGGPTTRGLYRRGVE